MKIRKLVFLAVLSLAVPSLSEAKLKIVATLPSFAAIASQVGGDQVEVMSLTKGNQDPHFVDAKPDLVLKLNHADLILRAGLSLEEGWLPPLVIGSRNGKIQPGGEGDLDVSTLMTLRDIPQGKVDRSMGDVHPGGNPHYMLDPHNGIRLAQGLAKKLATLDPVHEKDYLAKAQAFAKELEGKIKTWEKALAPYQGKSVVTYHRSWGYFSAWIGLVEAGYVEPKPGIPPSPEHVVRLIQLMKEKSVKWILIEHFYPTGTAEHIASSVGGKLLVLPTEVLAESEIKSYSDVFDEIIKRFKAVQ